MTLFSAIFLLSCTATVGGQTSPNVEARSREALAVARANIEKHRKGDARIDLARFRGRDVTVSVRQLSHEFKFGCYLKLDGLDAAQTRVYEDYFKRLFNYAVIGTYWDVTENKRGEHFWANFEAESAMARRNGWRVQAAPILWGTNGAGTPKWLPRGRDEIRGAVRDRIRRFFRTYGNVVDDVELVNEVLTPEPDAFGRDYAADAFRDARAASPHARLMINDFGVFGAMPENNRNADKYFDLVASLLNAGAPIDVVGIQAHSNREWLAPADVAEKLDKYAALGRPLQITEFSAQTKNYNDRKTFEKIAGAYRQGVWDEAKQAEFLREFYTIAFGNPRVEAIVQWGLDDARAWLPGIGLVGEDMRPKPNYEALDDLINRRWSTNLEVNSKGAPFTEFRGFFGLYEIEIKENGRTLAKETFELTKAGTQDGARTAVFALRK